MKPFELKDYKIFDLFNNQWALVTAGTADHYNTCTIGWGSFGTIWGRPGRARSIITVYVNPLRYTWDVLKESDRFTVEFFPENCRTALEYLGSHSGRDEDKVTAAGLTPKVLDGGVTFEEAELTFVCRKIYQGPFEESGMAEDVFREEYRHRPLHWMFVGEIISAEDKR